MQGLAILVNTEFNYFEVNFVIFQKFIEIHFLMVYQSISGGIY